MEQTYWQLLTLITGGIILCGVPSSESACFTNLSHTCSSHTTHFTYNGEALPILLEGSLVYRPTLDFLNNIVMILGTEILGYADIRIVKPTLYNPTETSLALSRVVGCGDTEISCPNTRSSDAPSINMAVWMSSLVADESWSFHGASGITQKGNHALYGRYGWYVSTDIVSTMWERSNVVGDHWRSLQNMQYINALSLSSQLKQMLDAENLFLYCDRPECVRGIFYPPWCDNQTQLIGSNGVSDCAVLLADYSDLNFQMLTSQILELQLNVKVAWVGPNLRYLVRRMTDLNQHVLFFALTPNDLLQYSSFSRISFPTCPTPQYMEGDYEVGGCDHTWHPLTKVMWSPVEINAPPLAQLIQTMYLDDSLVNNAFSEYAQSDLDMEEFACHWLTNNEMIWLDWFPSDSLTLRRYVYIPALFPTIDEGEELYGIYLAATMAVEAVNSNSDILPSVTVSMRSYATQCQSEETLDIYSDLIQENVKPLGGFVGPACSEECENLSGVSKYFNQIIISYFADSISLGAKDKHPFVFRVFPDIEETAFATEQIFNYFGWRNFAVISDPSVTLYSDPSSVEDHLLRTGMQCVYSSTSDGQSVDSLVAHVKHSQPEVVIVYCSERLAQELLCEAYKQGTTLENGFMWMLPFWYSDDWWDLDAQNRSDVVGCSSREMKIALNGGMTLSRVSLAEPDEMIAGDLTMSTWMEEHSSDLAKTNASFTPLAAYAYDVVWTYAFALHKLFETDITYLDSIQSLPTTMLFVENLKNTSFVGATGQVDFIQQDRRTAVTISLYFFDLDPTQVVLGQYIPVSGTANDGELNIDTEILDKLKEEFDPFVYEEQEYETCGVETVRFFLGSSCASAYVVICLFFTTIFLIMALGIGLLFKKKYDKKVKQAELRLKELGLLSLGMDSLSTLNKWEMPREKIILNRKLGEGAFGTVYGGEAFLEGQNWAAVAVKTLKMGSSIEEKLDFLSEAEMMKRFDHKNIVRLFGVCLNGEPLYTVMEFMLYGDLKTFLLARRHLVGQMSVEAEVLQPARLTAMVHDVASGLDYLANYNYVHRDLACRNCLVDDSYCIKIGDFGMTRALYDSDYYRLYKQGRLPVRWMAPESVAEGKFTTMSDIWSLGVVIYEVVTFGGFPYAEMSNTVVVDYIKDGNSMIPPENCPPLLSSLMMQCWVTEAAIRPTAKEIMDVLETNPELIVPCLSGPHESVSVDGLSQGTFSPGLSSRHSFRSTDADILSETSSGGFRSSFGSLRRALQNSFIKKGSKKKDGIKVSPTLSRKGDLEWANDWFVRQERKRSSERSTVSWSSELHAKMRPVMSELLRCGKNDLNSFTLQRFNSFDGVLNTPDVKPARSHTLDESFEGLSKKVHASQNEYCRQPQAEFKCREVKLRADSAPLIPKQGRRSQRKSRSRSITAGSTNLAYETKVAIISGSAVESSTDHFKMAAL